MPTRVPTRMPTPPIVGVGLGWTLRSEGWSMAPIRMARRRTRGVTAATVPAVARNTARNCFNSIGG